MVASSRCKMCSGCNVCIGQSVGLEAAAGSGKCSAAVVAVARVGVGGNDRYKLETKTTLKTFQRVIKN